MSFGSDPRFGIEPVDSHLPGLDRKSSSDRPGSNSQEKQRPLLPSASSQHYSASLSPTWSLTEGSWKPKFFLGLVFHISGLEGVLWSPVAGGWETHLIYLKNQKFNSQTEL